MDLHGEDMTILTGKYIVRREGTSKFLNERNMIRIFKSVLVEEVIDETEKPCFLWQKGSCLKMRLAKDRPYLNRFLYDYCVEDLSEGTHIIQMCDRSRICMQPFHYMKEKKKEKKEMNSDPIEEPKISFPSTDLMKTSSESGKAIVDANGNIFMTMEMFMRISSIDPFLIDPKGINENNNSEGES